ncbi:MAG: OmpA family protein [Bacteroidota bacterium]
MNIKEKISIVFILIFISISTFSQVDYTDVKIKRGEFKTKKEGFREAWQKIKDGDKYFKEGVGTFNLAAEKYFNAYDYNPTNAPLNYKIGVCILYTGQNRIKAIEYLEKAYEINKFVTPDIDYVLGRAYHLNMEFDKAISKYDGYLNSLDPDDVDKVSDKIAKLIKECRYGKELIKEPVRCIIRNLGNGVNSKYDDYNPVFHHDFDLMYFTSRRENTTKGERFELDNKFKEDIYTSEKSKEGETWQKAQNLTSLNTKYNDAAVGLYKNGKRLYIYNGNERGGDILYSDFEEGEWSKPSKLPKVLRSKGRETTMCLSPDEKTMYFVSKREVDEIGTVGGKDIYFARRNNEGEWQVPENIGATLNTRYDEEAIHLHPSGDTMFFSSKGHNSMGGYDIFMTYKDNSGRWVEPVNLGYPINTADNDLFYKLSDNPAEAYISTVKDEGFGGKDIYKIIYIGEEKQGIMSARDELLAWFAKPVHSMFYKIPEALRVDTTLYMKGTITDSKTDEPVVAKLQLIDKDKSEVVATTLSEEDGKYKIKLPERKNYGIEINAKGYMFYAESIDFRNRKFRNNVTQNDFKLEKVEVGAKMILKNIYFETAKATLKPESYPELNRVVRFLEDNESVKIEISGHTDNRGSWSYNKKLSEDRAKSVVEYIAGHGIKRSRLKHEGYSYDKPIATNDTEEGRAKNRRVEFQILSTD